MPNWKRLIRENQPAREAVRAETFVENYGSASGAVRLECDDGNDYVVKSRQAGRMIVTLSFEGQSAVDLQREYSAAAWALEDVRNRLKELPLAVVMLPPSSGASKTYDQARYVFDRLNARSVPEPEILQWAEDVAALVSAAPVSAPMSPRDAPT